VGRNNRPAILREEISRLSTVEVLQWPGVVDDRELNRLLQTNRLKTLKFENRAISDAQLAVVARVPTLTELTIRGRITNEGLKQLRGLSRLEVLDLSMSNVTDEGLKELASMPKLTRLAVMEMRITDEGLETLAGFPNLKVLECDAHACHQRCDRPHTKAFVPTWRLMWNSRSGEANGGGTLQEYFQGMRY
jgi:hypothetical protein